LKVSSICMKGSLARNLAPEVRNVKARTIGCWRRHKLSAAA
jgi:hypothetical protein